MASGYPTEKLRERHETYSLSWQDKLGWAIGELGVAIYVGGTMSFFLFYLTEAHSISPAWAGVALLVPRIWDGITDRSWGRFLTGPNPAWVAGDPIYLWAL